MDISKFLAKVIGLYLVIVSIAMFVDLNQFMFSVNSLINNGPLMFIAGFFTLILGVLLVVSHNRWVWNWRVIITVIAWLTLIKGASIILYPIFIDKMTLLFLQNMNAAYVAAGIDFLLGGLLCYFGFKR